MTAAFTPRDVTFVSPTTLKYSTTIYRVDRTDLAFSEEHKIGEKSFWRRGSCDRKSTRLKSSHECASRMPSSACNNEIDHANQTIFDDLIESLPILYITPEH